MKKFIIEDAKRVSVNVRMGARELEMQSGSDKLMEGEFIYNMPEWKPVIEYSKIGSDGKLDISLFLGAGKSNLRLNDINLENLQVNTGACKLNMDFER